MHLPTSKPLTLSLRVLEAGTWIMLTCLQTSARSQEQVSDLEAVSFEEERQQLQAGGRVQLGGHVALHSSKKQL